MPNLNKHNKKFTYKVHLRWTEQRKGIIASPDKPEIELSTPPEFMGHPGVWTPEDFFVAAVIGCLMTTFLYQAEKHKLKFSRLDIPGQGILEKVENQYIISKIELIPHLVISSTLDIDNAKKIFELAERYCVITNSIKSKIYLTPDIEVKNKGE